ncbi:MAG: Mur ligase family protein [Acidimicrobiaceae bacterium]|nr:Mur ligase family protein [Acidimicrobiaceae bacterium]
MDYDKAIDYLYSLVNYETIPHAGRIEGLRVDTTRKLMWYTGDPHKAYRVIHVTGTNGKGSAVQMIAQLLQSMGLRVGMFTSPHLVETTERIKVNNTPVTPAIFGELVGDIARIADLIDNRTTWFETITAAGFVHFANVAVDVAVVEVGMLGRFDATNVVEADVAVITNVAKDHTNGETGWRKAVAKEKAGIVKPSSRVVCGDTHPVVTAAFSAEQSKQMLERDKDFGVSENHLAVGGRCLSVYTPYTHYEDLFVKLHGSYQACNASLAVTAVETFFDAALPEDVITETLANITIDGRFEIIGRRPLVVLDVAHNTDGVKAATTTLYSDFAPSGRRLLVIGFQSGRDISEILKALEIDADLEVFACTAPTARGVLATEVAAIAERLGISSVEAYDDPAEAFQRAVASAQPEDSVLVCGSFTVVGAVKATLADTIVGH